MNVRHVVYGAIAWLVLVLCVANEVVRALVFGWLSFLGYVGSRVGVDRAGLILAGVALALFAAGVHWFGGAAVRRYHGPEETGRRWRVRWSLASALLVVVLFAAGTCLVGIVHQTAWLLTGPPLYGWAANGFTAESGLRETWRATENYCGCYNKPPWAAPPSPRTERLHSWETNILQFTGMYVKDLDYSLPWRHERNAHCFRGVVPFFINSDLGAAEYRDAEGFGLSHYAANARVVAADGTIDLPHLMKNGSNTILFGEVNAQFKPWGDPVNWRDPAKGINRSPDGFGGPPFSGGAKFAMADGSVRFVSERVSQGVLRALATPGAEPPSDRREGIDP